MQWQLGSFVLLLSLKYLCSCKTDMEGLNIRNRFCHRTTRPKLKALLFLSNRKTRDEFNFVII